MSDTLPSNEKVLEAYAAFNENTPESRAQFGQFLQKCIPYIMGFARHSHIPEDECFDVAQDVLLVLTQDFKHYHPEQNFSSWLGAIAHHKIADHKREYMRSEHNGTVADKLIKNWSERVPKPGAAGIIRSESDRVVLQTYIDSLPEDDLNVKIFKLRYMDDMPAKNVAALFGLTENAVHIKMTHFKEKMRHDLNRDFDEPYEFLHHRNEESVVVHIENCIAHVELNRPDKRNSFSSQMLKDLRATFDTLEKDPDVKAVILFGAGKSFCSGIDLEWLHSFKDDKDKINIQRARLLTRMFQHLKHFNKPLIAEVPPSYDRAGTPVATATGGGVGLAAVCDYVVAQQGAQFQISENKFKLRPAAIYPYIVERMGKEGALVALARSGPLSTAEAYESGLIDDVVNRGELHKAALRVAQQAAIHGKSWLKNYNAERMTTVPEGTYDNLDPRISKLIELTDVKLHHKATNDLGRKKAEDALMVDINKDLGDLFSDKEVQAKIGEYLAQRQAAKDEASSAGRSKR